MLRSAMMKRRRFSDCMEAFSAWLILAWGLLLVVPGDTFMTTPAYTLLRDWGEGPWSVIAISIGLLQTAGLFISYFNLGREIRLIGAGAAFCLWSLLGVLLFLGNPLGHGWIIYTSLAISMIFSMVSFWQSHKKIT